MDDNKIIQTIGKDVDKYFSDNKGIKFMKWQDKLQLIDTLAKKYNLNDLMKSNPIAFNKLKNYIDTKFTNQSIREGMKKIIKEENLLVQSSKPITQYEDSEVVKAIKDIIGGYSGFEVTNIQSNADQFFNIEVTADADGEWDNLEFKRQDIGKKLHKFRSDLLSDMGNKLPVVNVNIGAYKFNKNEDKLSFVATVLLSNTNNKDWATGKLKKDVKESKGLNESILKVLG